jgi:hypothetical protein
VIHSASRSVSPSKSPSRSPSISASVSPSPPPIPIFYRDSPIIFNNVANRETNIKNNQKTIPSWNTLGRPKNIKPGTIGYNFETDNLEVWDGNVWLTLSMKKI